MVFGQCPECIIAFYIKLSSGFFCKRAIFTSLFQSHRRAVSLLQTDFQEQSVTRRAHAPQEMLKKFNLRTADVVVETGTSLRLIEIRSSHSHNTLLLRSLCFVIIHSSMDEYFKNIWSSYPPPIFPAKLWTCDHMRCTRPFYENHPFV